MIRGSSLRRRVKRKKRDDPRVSRSCRSTLTHNRIRRQSRSAGRNRFSARVDETRHRIGKGSSNSGAKETAANIVAPSLHVTWLKRSHHVTRAHCTACCSRDHIMRHEDASQHEAQEVVPCITTCRISLGSRDRVACTRTGKIPRVTHPHPWFSRGLTPCIAVALG